LHAPCCARLRKRLAALAFRYSRKVLEDLGFRYFAIGT
jgi:hypothetical protein